MKYKQNLRIEGDKVFSYSTHVATISGNQLLIHGYWSKTTSKHINHVVDYYGLEKVNSPKEEVQEPESNFKTVAMIAKMSEIFCTTPKEKNDWKARMIKAGSPVDFPEDWDTLTEEEKECRLNRVIDVMNE